ncbi:MAG TPA: DUF4292 domain-containing protein [Myxococcota bacterium]|nr:DUF4292 domain-containing protein [Myxococcota bacterium]
MNRIAAAVALLGGLTACVSPAAFRPLPPGDPAAQRLLEAWLEHGRERHALRGLARLAVDQPGAAIPQRSKQLLVLARPSSLRVEVLGFLNQPLAVIATDGERFEVYRAEDRRIESGAVDEQLLRDQAGIDLRPADAVAVLLGVPLAEPAPAPARALRDRDGRIRIDLAAADGGGAQRATFDAAGRLDALERLDAAGAAIWVARFDDYRDVGGSPFAHSIALEVRAGPTRAEISFREVELNPELSPELFRLSPARSGAAPAAGAERR